MLFVFIEPSQLEDCTLKTRNFKVALNGFTPASIRNVPLHTAGELGWDDVGGLTDVKNILKETLLLPTKVGVIVNCKVYVL